MQLSNRIAPLLLVMLLACGGGKSTPPAYPDPDPAGSASAPKPAVAGSALALGELKFYQDNVLMMALHADGTLEAIDQYTAQPGMKKLATLTSDGKITLDNGGVFVVKPDGTVVQGDGSQRNNDGPNPSYTIDGDALVVAGQRIRIDDHGKLVTDGGPVEANKELRIEGANDPGTKRTALVLIGIVLNSAKPK